MGLVGGMTLKSSQTEPVLTAGTSAVTSLSAPQQDRRCTSLTSFSEAVRSRPAPHELVVKLNPSSVLLTSERVIGTSEVCPSASPCSVSILGAPRATFFDSPPPCRIRWPLATSCHSFLTPRTPTPWSAPRRCVRLRFSRHPPSLYPYRRARCTGRSASTEPHEHSRSQSRTLSSPGRGSRPRRCTGYRAAAEGAREFPRRGACLRAREAAVVL